MQVSLFHFEPKVNEELCKERRKRREWKVFMRCQAFERMQTGEHIVRHPWMISAECESGTNEKSILYLITLPKRLDKQFAMDHFPIYIPMPCAR